MKNIKKAVNVALIIKIAVSALALIIVFGALGSVFSGSSSGSSGGGSAPSRPSTPGITVPDTEQTEQTEQSLLNAMTDVYEVDKETALADIREFLDILRENDMLMEDRNPGL